MTFATSGYQRIMRQQARKAKARYHADKHAPRGSFAWHIAKLANEASRVYNAEADICSGTTGKLAVWERHA